MQTRSSRLTMFAKESIASMHGFLALLAISNMKLILTSPQVIRKSSHLVDKFKQYGLWERYAELYPDHDLVYTVGASDYTKDWFYAQVTRKNKDNTFMKSG
ncbi:hypothetical protein Scep_020290 [Stephania cephalantha]|uniref:Rhamnogalacturonan lyase domain-containing protein n=1 Tax=Stephania cephalantha TaxID=152367 RepID=A0AAP0IDF1_9MAGN